MSRQVWNAPQEQKIWCSRRPGAQIIIETGELVREGDPNYLLSCGCPTGIVTDEGHQEGCQKF